MKLQMSELEEAGNAKAQQCEELGMQSAVVACISLNHLSMSERKLKGFWRLTASELKKLQDAVTQRSLELAVEAREQEEAERCIKSQLLADLHAKQMHIGMHRWGRMVNTGTSMRLCHL